jgi:hypothetical protein
MRQGNGSDLLGLKDLRSTKIGIIYVASDDDRKSVLAAILTQEKLGRKQIAIVLPESQQNKAFQHSQDFDDLKTVQRKLRAQLLFIAPAGPNLAEFARQSRFSVYSSLESYADALRAESLSTSTVGHKSPTSRVEGAHPPKSGGLFMRGGTRLRSKGSKDRFFFFWSSRKAVPVVRVTFLLLCCAVISVAGLHLFQFGLSLVRGSAPVTIMITPESKIEQDSYIIQAVTDNADAAERQVSLRQLSFSPPSQSKSVTATGVGHTPAQAATGQLTFYNGSNQDYVVGSTTAIPGPNGISVETDGPADIPAAHPPTEGTITVNAHVTTTGSNGNMAAGAINGTCCASGSFITVVSSAFTGGQDKQNYTFLQQSDVDAYVNPLEPILSQQALNGLKSQLKAHEQLASNPQCTTQSSTDQSVGDQGHNVTSAHITVNVTCTGLAYDASRAQTLAENLLKRKAASDLGQSYALAGTIRARQTVINVNDGVVTLQVAVIGTWCYQFSDVQKQTLANQLANKTRATARGFLNAYTGIARVQIDIANGGNNFPSDPKQISIAVQE